jgi:molecular chaperone DnaK
LKGEDKSAIEEKTNTLMTASQKLGEKMYSDMQAKQAAQAAAGGGEGAGAGAESASSKPADDNVVDAEVKEVKKG